MKKLTVLVFLFLIAGSVHAQWTVFTPPNIGTPTGRDQVFDKPGNAALNFNRLGHLESGIYGDPREKWSAIGVPNMSFPPSSNSYYGFMANWDSDRAFFGVKNEGNNNVNAIIAFGDNYVGDTSDAPGFPGNRLIFQFDSWVPANSREIATMRANGFFGLGVVNPTAQLHTTGGVRFQGLVNGAGSMVVIDGNGNLFRGPQPQPGVVNNCSMLNFVPKVSGPLTLTCSQIQDLGTGVGIGMAPGTYTVGPLPVLTAGSPPLGGFVRLDVNGITRTTSLVVMSDSRFKDRIEPLKSPLESLLKLNGVQYKWKGEFIKDTGLAGGTQFGFIAQDVLKVLPNAVITDDKGFHGLNYNFFIPLLVESVKEQQRQIAELREQVQKLQRGR